MAEVSSQHVRDVRQARGLQLSIDALCDCCRHLKTSMHFFIERTLKEYRSAQRDGCIICGLVVDSIDAIIPAFSRSDSARVWLDEHRDHMDVPDSGVVVVMLEPSDQPGGRILIEIFRASEHEALEVPLGVSNMISRQPTDDYTIDKVQGWIRGCVEKHSNCSRAHGFMPDRLVDLGISDDSLHIWQRGTNTEPKPYIALSHCWGNPAIHEVPLKLLSTNVAEFCKSVPWSSLSATFKNAIQLCRRLDVRFLWIDSLCIVQDDKHDWRQQAALMAIIYQSAYVTVSASAAASGAEGLFRERPGTVCVLPGLHARRTFSHMSWQTPAVSYTGEEDAELPALTRAWCMQERLMSARVVHFSSNELCFECREGTLCECGYCSGLPDRGEVPWKAHFERIGDWYSLLTRYTACGITKGSDWLPALAGLAALNSRPSVRYCSGLWSDELLYGMTWHHLQPVAQRCPELGPSFSWVQTPGPVSYDPARYHRKVADFVYHASIIEAYWESDGVSPFLGAKNAYVQLSGMLIPIVCHESTSQLDGYRKPVLQFTASSLQDKQQTKAFGRVWLDTNASISSSGQLYWSPIWSDSDYERSQVTGLILVQNLEGSFERIALGQYGLGFQMYHGEKDEVLSLCQRQEFRLV